MAVTFRSLSTIEPSHYATPSAVGGADLLLATSNGKWIKVIRWNIKQCSQLTDSTKVRTLGINGAAPSTTVVVNAPSICSDHGEIDALLVFAQSRKSLTAFFGTKPATGSALLNAVP
jgi:hypothetical protein